MLNPGSPAFAELSLIDPERADAPDYRIVPGVATRLAPNVRRITAANPGYMTGPGTNSYIVGGGGGGGSGGAVAVIDPGPLRDDHIANLLGPNLLDAGERIGWIFVTHTHPDHSPAAVRLKQATGARLLGLPAPIGEHQDQTFHPDILPRDGERFDLAGCTLRAIYTPGHASNHVCYLLEEERILFTGDHVMQGSTVVINPPDGDMTAYIDSLRMLLGTGIAHFAPGHGFIIGEPDEMIELLVRHRFLRERKTLGVLTRLGSASLEALTPSVYDDVPAFKHPWAARSLLAHLVKLKRDGMIYEIDGVWSPA